MIASDGPQLRTATNLSLYLQAARAGEGVEAGWGSPGTEGAGEPHLEDSEPGSRLPAPEGPGNATGSPRPPPEMPNPACSSPPCPSGQKLRFCKPALISPGVIAVAPRSVPGQELSDTWSRAWQGWGPGRVLGLPAVQGGGCSREHLITPGDGALVPGSAWHMPGHGNTHPSHSSAWGLVQGNCTPRLPGACLPHASNSGGENQPSRLPHLHPRAPDRTPATHLAEVR